MSYKLKIENKYGELLELTNNPNYYVKATGLSPVVSNIITAPVANYGGERYISSRQQKRNIVLTIFVCEPVEANRVKLYQYIKSHEFIRVYFKNGARDVYIDGYVESFELDHFEQTQTAQVSIICPQPNFIDVSSLEVANAEVTKNFYFKFNTEIKSDEGTDSLEFTDLKTGVVKFSDFLVTPETAQQERLEGYNLIPYPYYQGSRVVNGITWTVNPDGTITASGTATKDAGLNIIHSSQKKHIAQGTYTISGFPETDKEKVYMWIAFRRDDNSYAKTYTLKNGSETLTFTVTEELSQCNLFISVNIYKDYTVNNLVFKPVLEAGSVAHSYEPYTHGLPAPNPYYPVEITGLGQLVNDVYSTTLVFESSGVTRSVTIPLTDDNSVNLIKGNGNTLIDDNNYLMSGIYTDGSILTDENNNSLFE